MKMKKLIPALAMLLVSAILLGTSTYAWFSMNTTVSATGMQINVVSNNTFLLINTGDNDTADEIQAAAVTTIPLTVSNSEAEVYPASPILSAYVSADATTNAAAHKYFASGNAVVSDAATAAVVDNWFTAQNNDPANANNSVKNVNKLNADDTNDATLYDFSGYVIKRTAYLTLADGSDDAHNLTVTPTIAAKTGTATDISGVKVLVATGDNMVILDENSAATSLHATTDTTLTDTSVVTVDVYIYYDGEESAVYTNNIADLAGADISLQFDVELV